MIDLEFLVCRSCWRGYDLLFPQHVCEKGRTRREEFRLGLPWTRWNYDLRPNNYGGRP